MRNRRNDGPPTGLSVHVRDNDIGRALSRFKKLVATDGILQEYKAGQYHEKRSAKKKREKAAGRARWLKKLNKTKEDYYR